MSHTPGPWTWTGSEFAASRGNVLELGDDGGCSDPECCGGPSYHIEVSEDDARLIAAAPELLEALEALLVMMDREQPRKLDTALSWRANDEYARALAASAIAKAEGR